MKNFCMLFVGLLSGIFLSGMEGSDEEYLQKLKCLSVSSSKVKALALELVQIVRDSSAMDAKEEQRKSAYRIKCNYRDEIRAQHNNLTCRSKLLNEELNDINTSSLSSDVKNRFTFEILQYQKRLNQKAALLQEELKKLDF